MTTAASPYAHDAANASIAHHCGKGWLGQQQSAIWVFREQELGTSPFVVLIGLLLIGVAAGFTVDVFLQNAHDVDVDVLSHTFTVGPGWIVIAGIGALATFLIGARLIAMGTRRARRRRTILRGAESAARERDQLTQQLAAERERKDEDAATVERREYPAGVPTSID